MEINASITLSEWLQEWLEIYKLPTVREKTADMYTWAVHAISADPCGQLAITDITEMDLQRLLNTAATTGYSKSSISKMRASLRQAYRPLLRQNVIGTDPTAELIIPRAPTKEVLPLTHKQREAVELASTTDPLGHLLIFLMETGLRRNELKDLLWTDYNAADHSIFVTASKTPAGIRKVYLTTKAEAIIPAMPHINDHIFNHTKGNPVTKTVMQRLVERIRRASGVLALTCHVCRHTFVTRLCEKKVPAKAIAQIIGHAKVDYVLDIYAKLEADELRKAIYALEPDGRGSAILGSEVRIPIDLYNALHQEADNQGISVDALVTHLLTLYVSAKGEK